MSGLNVLPGKTEMHVDGRHLAPLAHQLGDQDCTIETAAGQDGDGIRRDQGTYSSPR